MSYKMGLPEFGLCNRAMIIDELPLTQLFLDKKVTETSQRKLRVRTVDTRFGTVWNLKYISQSKQLSDSEHTVITSAVFVPQESTCTPAQS
jgi:hypothetical protein